MVRDLDTKLDALIDASTPFDQAISAIAAALSAIAEAAARTDLTDEDRIALRHAPNAIDALMRSASIMLAREASSVRLASYA